MANVLGLALKINADASGLRLDPAERALNRLGAEAEKTRSLFDAFASTSGSAAEAQKQFATDSAFLTSALKTGQITAADFADSYAQLKAQAEATAAVFQAGAETAASFQTAQEKNAQTIGELAEQLRLGAIEGSTFERAITQIAGVDFSGSAAGRDILESLAAAARDGSLDFQAASEQVSRFADVSTAAAATIERYATEQERAATQETARVATLQDLIEQYRAGEITAGTFGNAIAGTFDIDTAASDAIATSVNGIVRAVTSGAGDVQEFAQTLESLAQQQREVSAAEEELAKQQERASELVSSLVTKEQQRATLAIEYETLRKRGALTEGEYAALIEKLGPITEEARAAEEKLSQQRERAREIIESLVTPQDNYARTVAELDGLLKDGLLTQSQRNEAVSRAADALDRVTGATEQNAQAQRRADEIIRSQMTDLEKLIDLQGELQILLDKGVLPIENYTEALRRAAAGLSDSDLAAFAEKTGIAAEGLSADTKDAAESTTKLNDALKFLPGALGKAADLTVNLFNNMAQLGSVISDLPARISALAASLVPPLQRALTLVSTPFGAFAAAVAASGALSVGVSGLASRIERLSNQAEKLGLTFGFIQVIEEAAKRSGTSVEGVSSAFTRLQKTIAGAGEESKKSIAALAELGISFDEISRLAPQEQYIAIGQALLSIENPAQRTAAAIELFGKSGASLLPFFRDLDSAVRDVKRLGGAISDEDKKRFDDFTANANSLGRAITRLGEVAITPFAGIISGVTNVSAEFVNAVTAIAEIVGAVLQPILDTAGVALRALAPLLETIAVVLRTVAQAVEPLAKELLPTLALGFAALRLPALIATMGGVVLQLAAMTAATVVYTAAQVAATAAAITFRQALAATGIGVFVIAAGLAIDALLKWLTASDSTTDSTKSFGDAARAAAEDVRRYGGAVADLIAEDEKLRDTLGQVDQLLESAKEQSVAFGEEGFNAAVEFEERVRLLRDQLGRGMFNRETFRIEAQRAKIAFDAELKRIEEDASLEIKIKQDAEKTLAQIDAEISKAIESAQEFGREGFEAALSFQNALVGVKEEFQRGILNTTTVEREVNKANQEYDKQIQKLKAVRDEQQRAIDADNRRVEELRKASDTVSQVERDLQSLQREITRTQNQTIKDADHAARLNELKTIEAELETRVQAAAQGFEDGFQKTFESISDSISPLIDKAAEFGQAGVRAGVQLQEGIKAAQQQAENGILNKEALQREVEAQKRLFEQQIQDIQRVADERKRVNEFVDQQLQLAQFGGDQQRLQAAQRVVDLEREMVRVQNDVQAARAAGDQAAVNAGIQRLGQLDQVAAAERDVASGRAQAEQQIAQQREQYAKAIEDQQRQSQEQQRRFAEEQAKAVEAENQRQQARLRELNTLGAGVIRGNDIRTSEGASQFLQLAAQRQDPALIEARLQTRRLTEVRDAVLSLARLLPGTVYRIVGGVG